MSLTNKSCVCIYHASTECEVFIFDAQSYQPSDYGNVCHDYSAENSMDLLYRLQRLLLPRNVEFYSSK